LVEEAILGAILLHLEGLADRELESVHVERLQDVVGRTPLHRLDGGLDRAVRREHDERQLGVALAHASQEVEATAAGQPKVAQDQVDPLRRQGLERLLGTLRGHRLDAHLLEDHLQDAPHLALVVHHQGLLHRVSPATGSSTRNVVPRPTWLMSVTVPWCAWIMRWTIASPSPVPPTRPETNGVNTRSCNSGAMPGPSSSTSNPTRWSWGGSVRTVTRPPSGSAWIAFTSRLSATWYTCSGSQRAAGTGGNSPRTVSDFSRAWPSTKSRARCRTGASAVGSSSG